jgi:hypothetical protein
MTKVRGVTGGGASGNFIANTRAPKREPVNHPIDMQRPSMIGLQHWQNDAKGSLYNSTKASTPYGATDNTLAGVAANRVVMKSGSQGQHGAAVSGTARPGADKKIFPGFR